MILLNRYYKIDTSKLIKFVVPKDTSKSFVIKDDKTIAKGKHDYITLENIIGDIEDVQIRVKSLEDMLFKLLGFAKEKFLPNRGVYFFNEARVILNVFGFQKL